MKHLLHLILLFSALTAAAQSHLEFNGIPIGGSIAAFTGKMKSAGYRVHPSSKKMPAGMRYFVSSDSPDYDYLDYYSVCVKYDVATKTVFCVSQVYEFRNTIGGLAASGRLFDETKAHLDATYNAPGSCVSGVLESADALPFYGVDVNDGDCNFLGTVTVRIEYDPVLSEKIYLFIEFSDAANTQKYLNL